MAAGGLANTADVGSPGLPGDYSYVNGVHSLDGSGTDIGNAGDSFRFAWSSVAQDFSLSARVASFSASNPEAKTGIMVRNSATATGSAMAAVVVLPDARVEFIYRLTTSAAASVVTVAAASANYLRLTRTGFAIAGSYSTDGIQWTALGSPQRFTFDSGASQAGLAITAHTNNDYASSSFTNVAIIGGGSDFNHNDVGTPDGQGSVAYDSTLDTTTLAAGGTGIGGTADQFNFVSKPLSGAGSAIARVAAIGGSAEAGVMVRADASTGAAFAAVLVSPAGVRFAWRATAGAAAQSITGSGVTAPVSVKITRDGNAVQAYYSTDGGATWVRIGTGAAVTITLPATPLAGFAATANAADATVVTATFTGTSVGTTVSPGAGILTTADETFLDDLTHRTANWFIATQNVTSGLFPDRATVASASNGSDASMASTGFGLSALAIASSRGWIADGYTRALKTLTFLWNNANMSNPANHGYFYHFVNQTTGVRSGTSELSSIDTALLISGVLTAGQYWKGTAVETLAQQIYDRVEWTFMQPDGVNAKLRMAWTPESGFTSATWDSWSEGPLLYLLALGSNTHPISPATWLSFPRNQTTVTYAGMTFYAASGTPLFTNQYPQGWFDLRNKADLADADPSSAVVHLDPYLNSKKHTLAQRQASIDAAAGTDVRYDYYGANAWGLTASDSANGYQVFGGPPLTSNVDGTIAPTAPGGSLAFTPRESIDDLQNLKATYPNSYKTYGFVDAFNPRPAVNWYDTDAIGIDQGMLLVAAENLRSGLVWSSFMAHPEAQRAVSLAFTADANTATPSIVTSTFAYQTGQSIALAFNGDIANSLDATDIDIVNITTGQTIPSASWTFARSSAGKPTTATVTFTSGLPDGNYELRVRSNSVTSPDGTPNLNPLVASFYVLAGDANRDRVVDFNDLVILAQDYGQSGRNFSQGNFNYSTDGLVDFDDLVILAQKYGQSLPQLSLVAGADKSPSATKPRRPAITGLI